MSAADNQDQKASSEAAPAPRRRALDSLPQGARTTGAAAAARSRLVRRLRIALPMIALTLIAAFIVNTSSDKGERAFLEDFEDLSASAEELRMASPKFSGVDENGKPFEITADSALQRPGEGTIVELDNPRAAQGASEKAAIVTAEKGLYRSEEKILELSDGVTLEHAIGAETYVLRAPAATVMINEEKVVSEAGVGGEGSDGAKLEAERMTAYRADGRVRFEGNVKMRFYPKSGDGSGGTALPDSSNDNKEETPATTQTGQDE